MIKKYQRKLSVIMGFMLIVAGLIASSRIAKLPEKEKSNTIDKNISAVNVSTQKVKLQTVETYVETSGLVKAKNTVEIYSDVIGTVLPNNKKFKTGERFKKGESLLNIDKKEKELTLCAAKEDFYSSLISLLPDIKADFPESYDNWKNYTDEFNIAKSLDPLPEAKSEKEKYFMTSKKVFYKYLSIQSTEANLEKYTIKAPFDGVLTDGDVNPGTLVRSNQKLGEFIEEGVFEIQIDIPVDLLKDIKRGNKVEIFDDFTNQAITGKITRINSSVNSSTQTITAFASVNNDSFLKDGMYFKTKTYLKSFQDAYLIDKKYLNPDNQLVLVIDSKIKFATPKILGSQGNMVIIGNIKEGTEVVTQLLPSAFSGMLVNSTTN